MTVDPAVPIPLIALAAAGLAAGAVFSALRLAAGPGRAAAVAMARLASAAAICAMLLRPIVREPAAGQGLPRAVALVERPGPDLPAALRAAVLAGEVALFEFRADGGELERAAQDAIAACGARLAAALLVPGRSCSTAQPEAGAQPARSSLEDLAALAARLGSLGVKVWAVAPPEEGSGEIRIGPLSIVPAEPGVGEPVVASAELEASVPEGTRARVHWRLDGRLEASRELALRSGPNRVEHAFVCPSAGLHRLAVEAELPTAEASVFSAPVGAFFRAGLGPQRVLVLEGPPRPIYRTLRRALSSGASAAPGRIAAGPVELRRAFSLVTSSAVERTGTRLPLPADDRSFDEFDLLVLGDLRAQDFPPGSLERVASWVRRGGGLLVLAGERNLGPGGWGATALAQVLPVMVGLSDGEVEGPFDVRPAGRVGEPRPFPFGSLWAGLRSAAGGSRACSWRDLPELASVREVSGLREGASVPIVAVRPGRTLPLLIHWRAGRGRVAVLLSEDTPRWAEASEPARLAHDEFWRDLAAGLAAEPPDARADLPASVRVWIEAARGPWRPGEEVPFKVFVSEPAAEVVVRLSPLGAREPDPTPGGSVPRPVEVRTEPGSAVRSSFVMAPAEGSYVLSATPRRGPEASGTGAEAAAETRIDVGAGASRAPPGHERDARRALDNACIASGGGVSVEMRAFLDEAARFGSAGGTRGELRRDALPACALLACCVAFLAAEWSMRRAWGMP